MPADLFSQAVERLIDLFHHPDEEERRKLEHLLQQDTTGKLGLTRTPTLLRIGKEAGRRWGREPLLPTHGSMLTWLWKEVSRDPEKGPLGVRSGREIRLLLVGVLSTRVRQETEALWRWIQGILETLQDWETCDQLALRVVAPLLHHTPEQGWKTLKTWIRSPEKWVRRLAVASLPAYIRAHPDDASRCLNLLQPVMDDPERDVQKAVAWALREISKKNAEAVYSFLLLYATSSSKATRFILREGSKKLSPEQRDALLSQAQT